MCSIYLQYICAYICKVFPWIQSAGTYEDFARSNPDSAVIRDDLTPLDSRCRFCWYSRRFHALRPRCYGYLQRIYNLGSRPGGIYLDFARLDPDFMAIHDKFSRLDPDLACMYRDFRRLDWDLSLLSGPLNGHTVYIRIKHVRPILSLIHLAVPLVVPLVVPPFGPQKWDPLGDRQGDRQGDR